MNTYKLSFFGGWAEISYYQTIQLPDVVAPATDDTPEHTVPGGTQTIVLQCTSYHPTQLELIHADCATHGVTIEGDDAEAIAEWVADYVPPAPPTIDRTALCTQIDAEVDELYGKVIGHRAAEYEQAEREALAYADKAFADPAPPMVGAWATAKSWTGERAAQDIIAQALAWRGAQAYIRAQRLLRKEQIRIADSDDAVHAAVSAWQRAFGEIKKSLGVA